MVDYRRDTRFNIESKSGINIQKRRLRTIWKLQTNIIIKPYIHKICVAIVQKRLSKTLDKYVQSTQYGFKKDKSTADAIQIIRRVAEHGQQTRNKLHMVLLDWEKAFDRVDRETN